MGGGATRPFGGELPRCNNTDLTDAGQHVRIVRHLVNDVVLGSMRFLGHQREGHRKHQGDQRRDNGLKAYQTPWNGEG